VPLNVAKFARSHNVFLVSFASITMRYQMFTSALEVGGLFQGNRVFRSIPFCIREPHGLLAVKTTTVLEKECRVTELFE